MRHFLQWSALLGFTLLACTAHVNQAGVTSTGNAGEIAGMVYDGVGVTMARQALQAAAPQPADSAKVVLLNAQGAIVDSQRTNRDGGFIFRELEVGSYSVYAVFKQDTAHLSSVVLTETQGYQALMTIGGQSGRAPKGTSAVSLYSTDSGQVEQSFLLDYQYDSTQQKIQVKRRIGSVDVQGIWNVNFQAVNMTLRDSNQASCSQGGHFFSTLPKRVHDNNWFYNGDLRTDYVNATDSLCSSPLPDLQEMRSLNMGGLELIFDSTQVRAKFYQSDWCLSSSTNYTAVLASFTTGLVSTIDCNSYRVTSATPDTVVIRTLWYDPSAIAASLELTHRASVCIYTGLLADQSKSKCSTNTLLK